MTEPHYKKCKNCGCYIMPHDVISFENDSCECEESIRRSKLSIIFYSHLLEHENPVTKTRLAVSLSMIFYEINFLTSYYKRNLNEIDYNKKMKIYEKIKKDMRKIYKERYEKIKNED